MTSHNQLERLARANPAPHVADDPGATDALLHQLLTTPPEAAPKRWTRPRPRGIAAAVACLAFAVVVAFAAVPSSERPGGSPSLVARAYAAVVPGDRVVHEVVTSDWTTAGKQSGQERLEGWYRPSTGEAARTTGGDEGSVRVIVTKDGRVLIKGGDIARLTGDPGFVTQDPVRPGFRDHNRRDFTADFRRAFEAKELADRGPSSFDGRPAQRFQVTGGLDGIDALDWYVDPATGRPLGSIERISDQVVTRRLVEHEKLDPTAAILEHFQPGT